VTDIYNPLAASKQFATRMEQLLTSLRASAAPPPTTGRLVQKPDGTVTDRAGNVIYTPPAPPKGA